MTKPKFDVLTLADLNVDIVLSDADPEFGQKEKMISGYLLELGGSLPIFACQSAKLGLKTAVVGVLGDDTFGRFMMSRLKDCGVDTSEVEVRKNFRTGASFALCRGNDRAILTDEAGITALSPERVNEQLLSKARHIHVGNYFVISNLQPHFPRILELAKSIGMTVSLDPNWDPAEKWDGINEILKYTDIFFPNENEILAITHTSNLDQALEIAAQRVPLVVVKCGQSGSIARQGNKVWQVPTFKTDYKDGVGAGDSFDAGFLRGYLHGWSIEDSLRLGSYCGAMNTTKSGGIQGQPLWKELPDELKKK